MCIKLSARSDRYYQKDKKHEENVQQEVGCPHVTPGHFDGPEVEVTQYHSEQGVARVHRTTELFNLKIEKELIQLT